MIQEVGWGKGVGGDSFIFGPDFSPCGDIFAFSKTREGFFNFKEGYFYGQGLHGVLFLACKNFYLYL